MNFPKLLPKHISALPAGTYFCHGRNRQPTENANPTYKRSTHIKPEPDFLFDFVYFT